MKLFIKLLILLLIIHPTFSYAYQPETTHAGLTQEIVDFYNFFSYPQITNEEKELIIQGSIDEDYPKDRSLKHFYDPIRNIGFNDFPTSKQWASGEIIENEFSWEDALNAYARGDEELAFKTLGHIIHLIEDAGVPDHTRNDPHKGDGIEGAFTNESPYEKWTGENKNRETLRGLYLDLASEGIRPREESSLGEYFDFIANYSNRNFFSRDTIDGNLFKYEYPIESEVINEYSYGIDDVTGKRVKLLILFRDESTNKALKFLIDKEGNDTSVLSEYFDRLSRQIIPVGAGVIELFFKEAEIAREKYRKEQEDLRIKEEKRQEELEEANKKLSEGGFWDRTKYRIQYTWDYNIKTGTFAVAKRLREIMTDGPISLAQQGLYWTNALGFTGRTVGDIAATNSGDMVENAAEQVSEANNLFQQRVEENPNIILAGPVFALQNNVENNNQVSENVNSNQATEENFVPTLLNPISNPLPGGGGGAGFGGGIPPPVEEVVATGTESSENAQSAPETDITPPDISLSVAECAHSLAQSICFIATSTININWVSTATDTAYYQVSLDNVLSATTTNVNEQTNLSEGVHVIKVLAYDDSSNVGTSTEISVQYMQRPIVISEIAWAGTETSANNEWLEIYNRSNQSINLSNVSLRALDGTPNISLSGNISPNSYFLIERTDNNSVPAVEADLALPFSGSGGSGLSNDGEELVLIHNMGGQEIILDQTPSTATCSNWCFGNTSSFGTMARSSLNALGSLSSSWATDEFFNEGIFNNSGFVIIGTPKAPYVFIPVIIVPF